MECLLAAALFGATAPVAKVILASAGPFTAAGLLYLGAGLAALPFGSAPNPRARGPEPRQRRRLGGAVIAGGIVAPVLLMFGLRAAPAASVALWLALEMPATAVLAWWWFGEHPDRRTMGAVTLAVAAALLLAAPDRFALAWAGLLVAGAALAWGLDNNLTALTTGISPARYTMLKGTVAGVVNLGLGLAMEAGNPPWRAVAAALATGAVGYGGSLLLYVGASQRLGAVRAQVLFATAPVFGVLVAWGWLHERIGPLHGAAAALLGVAVLLLARERHAHPHRHGRLVHSHPHVHDPRHHHAH